MRYPLLAWFAMLGLTLFAPGCGESGAKEIRTFPMGDRVTMGHLIYTVFETQWHTHLGEEPNARLPQSRFMLLRVSIVNSGASETMVPTMSLVDDSGQTFTELSNGDGVTQWIGFLRQVKPAESAQGNIIFDVPPKHYKLRVTDENEQAVAMIDIPLSFGAETPEVPGQQQPGQDIIRKQ
jgi:hypothetical protein